jgi:hypothetical protein
MMFVRPLLSNRQLPANRSNTSETAFVSENVYAQTYPNNLCRLRSNGSRSGASKLNEDHSFRI